MRYLERISPHFPIRTELGPQATPVPFLLHGTGLDEVKHVLVNGVQVPIEHLNAETLQFDPSGYLPPTGQSTITVVAVFSEYEQLAIEAPCEPWLFVERVEPVPIPLGGGTIRLHGSGLDQAASVAMGHGASEPATIVAQSPNAIDVQYDSLVNHVPPGAVTAVFVYSGAHLPAGISPQEASAEVPVSHGEEITQHPHGHGLGHDAAGHAHDAGHGQGHGAAGHAAH